MLIKSKSDAVYMMNSEFCIILIICSPSVNGLWRNTHISVEI
jgi:hypothetical protein